MEPALGKTQCLICHRLPIVPLSSGDHRALPTQPQEAEPLLETEGGDNERRARTRGRLNHAFGDTEEEPRLRELSYHKGASGIETVCREVRGSFLEEVCGASQKRTLCLRTVF